MMILVLWTENVFSRGSGVCHIVYGIWGSYRRALPFSSFLFLCMVSFGMYLDDDEDIAILVDIASCFCKSEFNRFVINEVFEYLIDEVGFF